ncbi:hypothetical protein VOLCADRAFT_94950 [Volvox carteri f. nagariensis]|uniref:Uncharacterized protein n=1 Tax=Volvox carteri f. nagariensis TaxID=3068 RepID=D8U674_VOLCA|nr:uncharacterized protein VOLCADRAFT_94950 [Volvox carteri f. nagariensis]EFJ44804.1 hypothetical protein VOLCADRAFT_94950 [Volvox carteri f. nagariensis]|eukprot:XP_002954087.1 hypothetical protein VOLCADRAFT_94950 [Volvox carteri f. nagariensis]
MAFPVNIAFGCTAPAGASPIRRPRMRCSKYILQATADQQPAQSSSKNPLEQLRITTDPRRRSELLLELDSCWSECEERYVPSPAEDCLAKELGVGQSTVMLAAVQNPGLSSLDATSQVLPSLRALRSAGLSPQDVWFLAAKKHQLLAEPATLSRWLDFLLVYGMQPRDVQNFLLRSTPALMYGTTLYQAGAVVSFLKSLGLKDDLLASRVLCVWPELLGRDVEGQLRPVVTFLMSLGLEVAAVGRVVVMWPEVLLRSVEGQLAPWVTYLRELGCSTTQVGDVIGLCPHLLGFKPEEVFGDVLRALGDLAGICREDVRQMLSSSVAFLIAPSASAGVRAALECLLRHGFDKEQVREMVLARPELLAAKPHDLERSLKFVYHTVGGNNSTVLSCPLLLTKPLGQVLGPRYSFIQKQGLAHKYAGADGSTFEFYKLLVAEDAQWCASLGLSVNEYQGFKLVWDEEYSLKLHQEAASEFQEELKKLGIYEGS